MYNKMLKRLNVGLTTRKQVQNNVGLTMPTRNVGLTQTKVVNTELVSEPVNAPSGNNANLSGSGMSQSQAMEQANAIQFGSGKAGYIPHIRGLNRYSDMKSSILHKELPTGDGCTVSGSGLPDELPPEGTLGKAKLPGEILKRKLLLKMLKAKDKSRELGNTQNNAGSYSGGGAVADYAKALRLKIDKMKADKMKGGFLFLLPILVGAISAAVSKTPSKNFGDFMSNAWKKGIYYKIGQKIQGKGIEEEMSKIKLKLSDFPQPIQLVIKKAYDDMKDNPTVEKITSLAERIAPDVRKAFGAKLQTKANLVVNPLVQPPPSGSGKKVSRSYSGKGFNEATQKFDDDFTKNLVKELV